MRHYYIISGTLDEAMDWAVTNASKLIALKGLYVSDPAQIVDENPNGIFIGTWRDRKDLEEIFLKLINKTTYRTEKYSKILEVFNSIIS